MATEKLDTKASRRAAALRKYIAGVEKKNAAFKALPLNKRRVEIAKDALRLMRDELLTLDTGDYLNLTVPDTGRDIGHGIHARHAKVTDGGRFSLREEFATSGAQCTACARGSIVYAAMMRRGTMCNHSIGVSGEEIPKEFTVDMMINMETAFEGVTTCPAAYENVKDSYKLLEEWRDLSEYVPAPTRFEWIMNYIIKHDGAFDLRKFMQWGIKKLKLSEMKRYECITAIVDCGRLHWEYKLKDRDQVERRSHDEDVEDWSNQDIVNVTMGVLDVPDDQRELIKVEYA